MRGTNSTPLADNIVGSAQALYLWMTSQHNARSELLYEFLTMCKLAEEIFSREKRVPDLASPCYVLGDLHGNQMICVSSRKNCGL